MGALTMLTVVFVALKVTGAIAWSWWWVLLPMMAEVAAGLIFTSGWIWFMNRFTRRF